ncbi:MAG: inositol monophosphatase family protein [Saprospiraceae bacterium]
MSIYLKFDLSKLCLKVIEITREVGSFISSELGKVEDHHIVEKDLHSLVSYVDIESEKKLVVDLRKLIPDSGFITEENTTEISTNAEFTWIIDPLDGTTNYLRGIPIFCISIALLHQDKLVLGVIYHIMQDELFHTWKGGGAYLNGRPISVSNIQTIQEAVVATGFPYKVKKMAELTGILQVILNESRGVRRLGSAAIDLAYTACGRFDCYYEAAINPWDVAAGILLIEEAGGIVSDMDGSENPLFAKNILASNKNVYAEFLQLIQSAKNKI